MFRPNGLEKDSGILNRDGEECGAGIGRKGVCGGGSDE